LFVERGLPVTGLEFFQQAIKADPSYAKSHLNLGLLYMGMGQMEQAEPQLRAAVALAPQDPRALGAIGLFYWRRGERSRAERAARARPFPGLAPPADGGALTAPELGAALAGLPAARICLVPAPRAADVLAIIGWSMFEEPYEPVPVSNAVWIGAVLRSWEDRFGARLLSISPDAAELHLLVQRPPRTEQAAEPIAAEQRAFAHESLEAFDEIPQLARALVNAPIWRFWWD